MLDSPGNIDPTRSIAGSKHRFESVVVNVVLNSLRSCTWLWTGANSNESREEKPRNQDITAETLLKVGLTELNGISPTNVGHLR